MASPQDLADNPCPILAPNRSPNSQHAAASVHTAEPQQQLDQNSQVNSETVHHTLPAGDRPGTISRAREAYIVGYLIFFSILGTLARIGIQWLTFYPRAPIVFANIWANVGGSLFMGFLNEDQKLFRQEMHRAPEQFRGAHGKDCEPMSKLRTAQTKIKKTIPLFVGLTTGFCGSFTSFSTFMRDTFFALSDQTPVPVSEVVAVQRNGGYSFMAVIAVIATTVCMSVGALVLGAHVAKALDQHVPAVPARLMRRLLNPLFVILGSAAWLGAILLVIFPPDRPVGSSSTRTWQNETWRGEVLFALVFAPAGCLARYFVSLKLNSRVASFPMGTFVVNMTGTAILGICYCIQHISLAKEAGLVGGGLVGCQVLQGIEDGFSGCLTTVSTWVLELVSMKRGHAYTYGLTSILGGLALTVAIMGAVNWSIGFETAACVIGRS